MKEALDKLKIKAEDAIRKNYLNDVSTQELLGKKHASEFMAKYISSGKIFEIEPKMNFN